MTLNEKNKWRLRFKIYSMGLVTVVLIIGVVLTLVGKVEPFIGIATNIIVFATGVFGIDYFSAPSKTPKDDDNDEKDVHGKYNRGFKDIV